MKIDHFLVPKEWTNHFDANKILLTECNVMTDQKGSDHQPIRIKLRLPDDSKMLTTTESLNTHSQLESTTQMSEINSLESTDSKEQRITTLECQILIPSKTNKKDSQQNKHKQVYYQKLRENNNISTLIAPLLPTDEIKKKSKK